MGYPRGGLDKALQLASDLENEEIVHIADELPVLPLRDAVLFPYAILPLSVSRETSAKALEASLASDRVIFLLAQRDSRIDNPAQDELHEVGCVGTVMRVVKLPDGSEVSLETGDNRMTIKAGRSRFSLPTLPRDDFPVIVEGDLPTSFELAAKTLAELIDRLFHVHGTAHGTGGVDAGPACLFRRDRSGRREPGLLCLHRAGPVQRQSSTVPTGTSVPGCRRTGRPSIDAARTMP